jgi:hypothetical protein
MKRVHFITEVRSLTKGSFCEELFTYEVSFQEEMIIINNQSNLIISWRKLRSDKKLRIYIRKISNELWIFLEMFAVMKSSCLKKKCLFS